MVDFEGDIREYDILWINILEKGPIDIGADELILYSLLSDVNNNGVVDFDVSVVALLGREQFYQQYSQECWENADCNEDGSVDFDDIDGFVMILSGS